MAQDTPTPWSLDEVLAQVASGAAHSVRFVETRHSALLQEPLQASGELSWQPPDTLLRRIDSPVSQQFEIHRDHVDMTRADGKTRRVALTRMPALAALATTFYALLSGEAGGLREQFDATPGGTRQSWQLQLRPRQKAVAREIERIEIRGDAQGVQSVAVHERDGDYSVTRLQRDEPH